MWAGTVGWAWSSPPQPRPGAKQGSCRHGPSVPTGSCRRTLGRTGRVCCSRSRVERDVLHQGEVCRRLQAAKGCKCKQQCIHFTQVAPKLVPGCLHLHRSLTLLTACPVVLWPTYDASMGAWACCPTGAQSGRLNTWRRTHRANFSTELMDSRICGEGEGEGPPGSPGQEGCQTLPGSWHELQEVLPLSSGRGQGWALRTHVQVQREPAP